MVDDEDEALAMPDDEAHRRAWEKWDAMACAISQPQLQAQRFKVLYEAAVEDVRTARQALLDVFEELEGSEEGDAINALARIKEYTDKLPIAQTTGGILHTLVTGIAQDAQ
jgi:hypothetical protein